MRDEVVDFVTYWSERTELAAKLFLLWIGIGTSKYATWKKRYGKANEHNGKIPRDFWLESWEKEAIVKFHDEYPLEGYRRLSFMMLDRDVVAVSPATTYRVLKTAGRIRPASKTNSQKGQGFHQPTRPHQHWHIDVSYLNICGTFYYLCSILDGFSRSIIHWEIREAMTEEDVEIVLQRAREAYPEAKPRLISDNGPQFIARDFKAFVRLCGFEHVRTSPHYPQSNGKKERWYKTLKTECIRKKTPLSLDDARRVVEDFVTHYNQVRLHSAIGYVTPHDMLEGRAKDIQDARDHKLEEAREKRKEKRRATQAA
ncbi:MAG: IS3 family transposase [Bradymonadaceae bacterium]